MMYLIPMAVDLQKKYQQPVVMPDVLVVPGEKNAHIWQVTVTNGGVAPDLSGYAVIAKFQRADGYMSTVNGSAVENVASVVFSEPLYAIPGTLRGQFFISNGYCTTALVEALFNVRIDISGNAALSVDQIVYRPAEQRIVYNGDSYYDVTSTTATTGDVRDGMNFFQSDGTLATGNADFTVAVTGLTVTAELIEGEDYEIIVSGEAAT